jgi:ribosome-associated translation inhibitor RaiA
MGRASTRWRRFWGISRKELRPPLSIVGRRPLLGEPRSGVHGRGWQHRRRALEQQTAPPPPEVSPTGGFPLTLVADDGVGGEARAHARDVLERLARSARRPVLGAKIVLRILRDPALERPAVVKATLQVGSRHVRAHVAAATLVEAVDMVERRLRRNLERLEELERTRRRETGVSGPGEWRHGDLPTSRPERYPRPAGERELVRRKTFASVPVTPEEAAREMAALDYDFFLFTNADTGDESVVYRRPDGSTDLRHATLLFLEQAIERLDVSGEPFVFFVDPQTRRGNLL